MSICRQLLYWCDKLIKCHTDIDSFSDDATMLFKHLGETLLSIFTGTQPSIGSTFQTRHFLRHFFLSSTPPQKQCPFQCWIDFIVPTPNGHYLVVGPLSISSLSYSYESRLSPFFFLESHGSGPYACKSMAKRYETSKRPTEVERNGKR